MFDSYYYNYIFQLKMSKKINYQSCAVPKCKNTSIKTPEKLFVSVPKDSNKRNLWLRLATRDSGEVGVNTVIYFCEDHFNLEEDMENYTRYKIMGSVKKVIMKPDCVPSKFECQDRHNGCFELPKLPADVTEIYLDMNDTIPLAYSQPATTDEDPLSIKTEELIPSTTRTMLEVRENALTNVTGCKVISQKPSRIKFGYPVRYTLKPKITSTSPFKIPKKTVGILPLPGKCKIRRVL